MASPDLTTPESMHTWLQQTGYPVTNVELLSSSHGGFVFRANLLPSDAEPRKSLIAKHLQPFLLQAVNIHLEPSRLVHEFNAQELVAELSSSDSAVRVRAPRTICYYDAEHVLLMEDAGKIPNLKAWCVPGVSVRRAKRIGEAMGRVLANFHDSTSGDERIQARFQGNQVGKEISASVYYRLLPGVAKQWGFMDEFIAEVAKEAEREILEAEEVLSYGDFWTGNVLVPEVKDRNEKDFEDREEELFVIDGDLMKPGTAEFDVGQMAAELFFLKSVRDDATGTALLEGFLQSYRQTRQGSVDVVRIATRVGAHCMTVVPWVWMAEVGETRGKEVMIAGRDLIRMSSQRDETALRESILGSLFR